MKKRNFMIWMLSVLILSLANVVEGNAKTMASPAVSNPCQTPLKATAAGSSLLCHSDDDGTATVNVLNGIPPFVYQWDDADFQQTSTATGLTGGLYFVTVTDSNGCPVVAAALVYAPPKIAISITTTPESTSGSNDGSATANASGGIPPYNYLWSSGENSSAIFGKAAGTYSVTVTDQNGCQQSASALIALAQVPSPPAQCFPITITTVDISCYGLCDGLASVVPKAPGTYSYIWSNGSSQPIAAGLCKGKHSVTVTDQTGCSVVGSVFIKEPAPLNVALTPTNTFCYDSCDGSIKATPSGGTGPFFYKWNDPNAQTSMTATGLCAGSYTVTVTDGNGCTTTGTIMVDQPTPLDVDLTTTDITCYGARDGMADLVISGGTSPYDWKYNRNGHSFSVFMKYNGPLHADNLKWGIYGVMVRDANGCLVSTEDTIIQPSRLKVVLLAKGATPCTDSLSAMAYAKTWGGTPPYEYAWNNGDSTDTLSNIPGGYYRVTVTDASGCKEVRDRFIRSYPIRLKIHKDDVTCPNGQDGSAKVFVFGGEYPYKFIWSDLGSTSWINTGLAAGDYCVTVIDKFGCEDTACFTITAPPKFSVTLSADSTKCYGSSDGRLKVESVTGGKPPYTFVWSNGATGATIKNVIAGKYKVTVTDQNGCTFSPNTPVIVYQPDPIRWNAMKYDVTCNGAHDGAIFATPKGGTPPFIYWWSGGKQQFSQNLVTALSSGYYTVSVIDANKCASDTTIKINEPDTIDYSISSSNNNCFGDSMGMAEVTWVGGGNGGPYTFAWDDPEGQTTSKATGLTAGVYHVTISDAGASSVDNLNNPFTNICTNVVRVRIYQKNLILQLSTVDVKCNGAQTGEAHLTVFGGNGPLKYIWSNFGSITEKNVGLPAGSYSVTVTDVNGCSEALSFVINEPPPIDLTLDADSVSCYAYKDGRLEVENVVGGKSPYTFVWDRIYDPKSPYGPDCPKMNDVPYTASIPQLTGPVVKGVCAGIYQVTVSDQHGCTTTETIEVGQPDSVRIKMIKFDESCWDAQDGAALAMGRDGVAPYKYKWSGGFNPGDTLKTGVDVNGGARTRLAKGYYTVTVTDDNGCYNTKTIHIDEPYPLKFNMLYGDKITCWNGNDGQAFAKPQGGNDGAYYYQWNDPAMQTTPLATGLTAGTYTITIRDSGAISVDSFGNMTFVYCSITDSVTIHQPEITYTKKDVDCNGAQTGSITVNVGNANFPVKYIWSNNGSTTNINNNLPAGIYGLTVVDAMGCRDSIEITINERSPIDFTASSVSTSCYGSYDGELHVNSVTGGKAPYTFEWSNKNSGAHVKGVGAGKYKVTVTDQLNCTATSNIPVIVEEPAPITFKPTIYDVTCNGSKDGAIQVDVNGGTPPYILWVSGGTSTSGTPGLYTSLAPGMYSLSVTDVNKCPHDTTFKIFQPDTIALETEVEKINCFGVADGSASVSAIGGNGDPYTYLWNDPAGQTTSTATGLTSGHYIVTVWDKGAIHVADNGAMTTVNCFDTAHVYIPQNNLELTISGKNVDCYGAQTGSAEVLVTGSKGDLKYLWSNFGSITNKIYNIPAGVYSVTVIDENGCSDSASITITQPPPLAISLGADDVSCYGGYDGRAFVQNITGGKPPYQFYWSSGDYGPVAKGLSPGKYKVTATDQNGCTISPNTQVVVGQPSKIHFNALKADVSCYGAKDGAAYVDALGGTPPFIYWWSGGKQISGNPKLITSLAPGSYYVSVVDANKCTHDTTITIEQPDPIVLTSWASKVDCHGNATGSATVSVTGGNGEPYTYLWNDPQGQTTSTATGLTSGYYIVTVWDKGALHANDFGTLIPVNCSKTDTVYVPENYLQVTVETTDITCNGFQDGTAKATVTGSKGSIKYLWSNYGSITKNNTGLSAGTYSITVTDGNGCSAADTFTIVEPAPLTAMLFSDSVSCFGKSDGRVGVSKVNGGTPPYTFQWSTGATSPVVKGLIANHYSVTITDQNGCTISDDINLYQPPQILLLGGSTPATICKPTCNGAAAVTVLNGSGPYAYMWQNKITTPTLTTVCPGTYKVTVTNSSGCTNSISITVADSCKIESTQKLSGTISTESGLTTFIYPNPFNDQANLTILSDVDMEIRVDLFDITGKEIRNLTEQSIKAGQQYNVMVERDKLPDGVYFYRISSNGAVKDWGRLIIN